LDQGIEIEVTFSNSTVRVFPFGSVGKPRRQNHSRFIVGVADLSHPQKGESFPLLSGAARCPISKHSLNRVSRIHRLSLHTPTWREVSFGSFATQVFNDRNSRMSAIPPTADMLSHRRKVTRWADIVNAGGSIG
jgi:hypothetical protein